MLTSERLNCCLSEMEETMRRQKDAYERAVESRNVTGVYLVDRSSSSSSHSSNRSSTFVRFSCVFSELAERRGLQATQEAEVELSRLKSRAGQLEHQLQLQQKRCRELPQLAEEKTRMVVAAGERQEGEVYCESTAPPIEDLQAREKELQKQLRAKQSHLIDLELQIEELDALNGRQRVQRGVYVDMNEAGPSWSDSICVQTFLLLLLLLLMLLLCVSVSEELQKQVSPDRELAVELLQRLGSLRQRLEEIRRKKRCLSSEAIMYKTMLPQLDCMQQRLVEELEAARMNVLQRLPPSEAVAAELQQQEERRRKKRQILEDMEEVKRQEKERMLPRSSAPLRPTLYLPPEGLGEDCLPRAYGAHKPFLPTPPPPNLRYYNTRSTE
ncbi:hypothetical protein ACSSS7_005196 [Eimeria intestinalis]